VAANGLWCRCSACLPANVTNADNVQGPHRHGGALSFDLATADLALAGFCNGPFNPCRGTFHWPAVDLIYSAPVSNVSHFPNPKPAIFFRNFFRFRRAGLD
jgi:hypothetical protein